MGTEGYLFDANAVLGLVYDDEFDVLFDEAALDLAFYEATNAAWKIAAHRGDLSRREGGALVGHLERLKGEMRVVPLAEIGATEVYEAAWDTGLSGYDAAYVVAADARDHTLVTNDGGIHDHAPDGVDVRRPDNL